MTQQGITRRGLMVGAAAATMILAAATAAEAQMKVKVVFPTAATTWAVPFVAAQDQGWFKEFGVEIEEVWLTGDATGLRTVIAGDNDVALTGPGPLYSAIAGGAKVKNIGSWQPVVDYNIVAKKGITSLEQLKDKTFAGIQPGEMPNELPKLLFKNSNIDASKVEFIAVGGHPARLQAVVAGKADAALVNTFTAVSGAAKGDVTILRKLKPDFPNLGYLMLAARDDALQNPDKRKALVGFMAGVIKGSRWAVKNSDAASELLAKRMKLPAEQLPLLKEVVKDLTDQGMWGVDGGASKAVYDYTEKVHLEFNLIKAPVPAKDGLDQSIADEAVKRLGNYAG